MGYVDLVMSGKQTFQATNPGQFETPETEVQWLKANQLMYTQGPVAIGGDWASPGALLTVGGDIFHAGENSIIDSIESDDN